MMRGRYQFLGRSPLRFTTRRLLFLSFTIISFILLSIFGLSFNSTPSEIQTYPLVELGTSACENWETKRITKIPNIVHYILLSPHPSPTSFNLTFKFFISIYSTHVFFRPSIIYIHTDIPFSTFTTAKNNGNEWTKRILALPNIKYHFIAPPLVTKKGVPIASLRDRRELLKIEILFEYGGIYLSNNAVPLRSISSLLKSGFATILSTTTSSSSIPGAGSVYNGVILSAPRSALMEIYLKSAHEFYSSSPSFLSSFPTSRTQNRKFFTTLLTSLTTRLSLIPHEILLLSSSAFAPLSPSTSDVSRLWIPYYETVAGLDVLGYNEGENISSCKDVLGLMISTLR